MKYNEKLNHIRWSKNMSFYELGIRCGLSESTIKKILYGNTVPLVSSVEKLCKALDVTLAELFCDKDEMVYKGTNETLALISIFNTLPVEAKKHLHDFLKTFG